MKCNFGSKMNAMKNEQDMTMYRKGSLAGQQQAEETTYLGYVNGKLTRFFLKYIPSTNQYIKVEVAG